MYMLPLKNLKICAICRVREFKNVSIKRRPRPCYIDIDPKTQKCYPEFELT